MEYQVVQKLCPPKDYLRLMLVLFVSKHSLASGQVQETGESWLEEAEEEEEGVTILCTPQTDSPRWSTSFDLMHYWW